MAASIVGDREVKRTMEVPPEETQLSNISRYKRILPSEDKTSIVDRLLHSIDLDILLVKPNIDENEDVATQIMQTVNISGVSASQSSVGFTVIDPGKIGILNHNGRIEVVGSGRWKNLNLRSAWVDGDFSLTKLPIKIETLTIVRVPKGSYGLATENGKPLILAEGLHVRNDRNFSYMELRDANSVHVKNGTINIIRIPPGHFGRVVEDNVSKLILPGLYATNNNYFSYQDFVASNNDYIPHNTIHLVRVSKSGICPIYVDNRPHLLSERNTCVQHSTIQNGTI
jgi:hypothetical protein